MNKAKNLKEAIAVGYAKLWFSEEEAEIYTSLSRSTLLECRNKGKITYRTHGRKIIYKKDDLDKFIEKHTSLVKSVEDRLKQLK